MVWLKSVRPAIWLCCFVLAFVPTGKAGAAEGVPDGLPRYDLVMNVEPLAGRVEGRMSATWTNTTSRPTRQLVFNVHSRYVVPSKEMPVVAKTLELLRVQPGEALGFDQPAFQLQRVETNNGQILSCQWTGDTLTALVVELPQEIQSGQSATVVLSFTMLLPPKQGRWGRYNDVTFLSNWLPVFAVYQDTWQPVPFVPWHQPFYNEAGHYTVKASVPKDHVVACSGSITGTNCEGERKWVAIQSGGPVRDFAFLASARYQEHVGEAVVGTRKVRIRVVALPEHEHYGKVMVRVATHAIECFSKWIGPYPYDEFTIAESFFGWLGNECSTLVMVDARVFGLPHIAEEYVEYLISHEVCHQWFYNIIGTNGYAETWMDESMAEFFAHRLIDQKIGKNNTLFNFPVGLRWLPNVHRQDYRAYGMYGAIGRGDNGPVVRAMPEFGHIANLLSMTYDKGSRIIAAIEQRLGDAAFLDFVKRLYSRYKFRILRVADFRRELEEYTGHSWAEFCDHWLYGSGLSDWMVESVETEGPPSCLDPRKLITPSTGKSKVTVILKQKGTFCEQTTLGIGFCSAPGYPIRVPILPRAGAYAIEEHGGSFEPLGDNRFKIVLHTDRDPAQVMVDPDLVLVDTDPSNNRWRPEVRWRFTPLYTFLEETDLTAAYDRWNVIFGPWLYGAMYSDPWYTRSTMLGLRVGAVRTAQFYGGGYAAVRQDYRDIVAGVDGIIDHWPYPHFQVGYNIERRLDTWYAGDDHATRGVVYGRHIFNYGSSMYLPPMQYLEGFALYEDNFFPEARQIGDADDERALLRDPIKTNDIRPGERFKYLSTAGLHYRLNYLTPYWNPEFGFLLDLSYQGGVVELDKVEGMNKFTGMFTWVHAMPDFSGTVSDETEAGKSLNTALRWAAQSRVAFRVGGGIAFPDRAQFFALGGPTMLRGFDLTERQGSAVWVASAEWRVPLATGLNLDVADHAVGLRSVYGAAFYDVGQAYVQGKPIGTIAHSVGAGVRLDVSWFSFVERTTLRLDVAKAVNAETAAQFWFGLQQPF